MLNRTIGRLCGFSVGLFGRRSGLHFSHFLLLLRREPASPEFRLTFVFSSGRDGFPGVAANILDCPPANAIFTGGAAAPTASATKRSARRQLASAHFYRIMSLSSYSAAIASASISRIDSATFTIIEHSTRLRNRSQLNS